MGVDAREFRAAMARWATGVTIVTSRAGERIHGMTVSDFAGVSLDPPLVLVCADKSTHTHARIAEGGCFAANFLAAGQEALADRFASRELEWQRFDALECTEAVTGAPLVPGALASLDCKVVATHEAGDHVIYVGRVEAVVHGEGGPLLYYEGAYRALADPAS